MRRGAGPQASPSADAAAKQVYAKGTPRDRQESARLAALDGAYVARAACRAADPEIRRLRQDLHLVDDDRARDASRAACELAVAHLESVGLANPISTRVLRLIWQGAA
ncbi:MAG: hypothetical protein M3O32_05085 [Actinomycetota bacterium]|nr:hypothetical protein [Actinomycetota bacterium]